MRRPCLMFGAAGSVELLCLRIFVQTLHPRSNVASPVSLTLHCRREEDLFFLHFALPKTRYVCSIESDAMRMTNEEERLVRLRRTLHSLATRVPKVILKRVECTFPVLKNRAVSVMN
jgi:hypothetical protein